MSAPASPQKSPAETQTPGAERRLVLVDGDADALAWCIATTQPFTVVTEGFWAAGSDDDAASAVDALERVLSNEQGDWALVTHADRDVRIPLAAAARDRGVTLPPWLAQPTYFALTREVAKWMRHHPAAASEIASMELRDLCYYFNAEHCLDDPAMPEPLRRAKSMANLARALLAYHFPDVLSEPVDSQQGMANFLSAQSPVVHIAGLPQGTAGPTVTEPDLLAWFRSLGHQPVRLLRLMRPTAADPWAVPTGDAFAVFASHDEARKALDATARVFAIKPFPDSTAAPQDLLLLEVSPSLPAVLQQAEFHLAPFPIMATPTSQAQQQQSHQLHQGPIVHHVPMRGPRDGQHRSSTPSAQYRPGDWFCPNPDCNFLNFASRRECHRCGLPAPPGVGGMGSGGASNQNLYRSSPHPPAQHHLRSEGGYGMTAPPHQSPMPQPPRFPSPGPRYSGSPRQFPATSIPGYDSLPIQPQNVPVSSMGYNTGYDSIAAPKASPALNPQYMRASTASPMLPPATAPGMPSGPGRYGSPMLGPGPLSPPPLPPPVMHHISGYNQQYTRSPQTRPRGHSHPHAYDPHHSYGHGHGGHQHKSPGMRPGDWICPNSDCRFQNFASRAMCLRCGTPSPTPPSALSSVPFRAGDWLCAACTAHNFASRLNCVRCGCAKAVSVSMALAAAGASSNIAATAGNNSPRLTALAQLPNQGPALSMGSDTPPPPPPLMRGHSTPALVPRTATPSAPGTPVSVPRTPGGGPLQSGGTAPSTPRTSVMTPLSALSSAHAAGVMLPPASSSSGHLPRGNPY